MRAKLGTFGWGAFVMVAALALTLYVAGRQQIFVEEQNIASPDVPVGPVTLYFFGVVAVMAVILFFIPLDKLKLVFRGLFTLMYAWGVFIVSALLLPDAAAWPLAAIAGLAWLFFPRIWLHNLVLLVTLSGAGSVFGFLFSPWTFMIFMFIIAVYDIVAVRFGFMVWMADKFSETTALPAFIFPRKLRDWRLGLSVVRVGDLKDQEPEEREYSILGGGDIGFPLMLAVAVYFSIGAGAAWLVGLFAVAGLMAAYLIQVLWLKEKPMPALPPIAVMSLIGWLIASAWLG
ncbi:MAG: presenilin family intramembrane aspartyl protease [Dehalococcoidales bacterium]|nr:presenilin family intramembrane aspartyl protease [Dehalococcoidales bacterium]